MSHITIPITRGNNQHNTVSQSATSMTPGEAKDNNGIIVSTLPLFSKKAIVLFDSGATHSSR